MEGEEEDVEEEEEEEEEEEYGVVVVDGKMKNGNNNEEGGRKNKSKMEMLKDKHQQLKRVKLDYERRQTKTENDILKHEQRIFEYSNEKVVFENRDLFSTANLRTFAVFNRVMKDDVRKIRYSLQEEHDEAYNRMKLAYIKQTLAPQQQEDLIDEREFVVDMFSMFIRQKATKGGAEPWELCIKGVAHHKVLPWMTLDGVKISFADAQTHFPESAMVAQRLSEHALSDDALVSIVPSEKRALHKPPTKSSITRMELVYSYTKFKSTEPPVFLPFDSIDPMLEMASGYINSSNHVDLNDIQKELLFDEFSVLLKHYVCDTLSNLYDQDPPPPWINPGIIKSLWPSLQSTDDVIDLFCRN